VKNANLLLLAGMGADEGLFARQREAFPDLTVLPWPAPAPHESLRDYAARLAKLAPADRPLFVGGASFGGLVARELAAHLDAEACFLICSVRSGTELSWRWRVLRPLAELGPVRLGRLAVALGLVAGVALPRGTRRRLLRLGEQRSAFARWAICAALKYRPSPAARRVPVYQIHGERDQTLPVGRTRPHVTVPGAGHLLPLTHAAAVNDFLLWGMERHLAQPLLRSSSRR
jgi:pimeloyl-ACP methyl ester carboxylesterase